MAQLLARSAEDLFWLARYLERIENSTRILEVTDSFTRDIEGTNWLSVIQIYSDEKSFFLKHLKATGEAVKDFYILDTDNPTSIQSAILNAHLIARSLRPVISIELWEHINIMCHRLRLFSKDDINPKQFSKICQKIRIECHIHQGIVDVSLPRDEIWLFYQLGKMIECADQTSRLLDIKYHILQPDGPLGLGSALDISQWNALLRSAAGYQAFRRLYQGRLHPSAVVQFLLFSDTFPRSISYAIIQSGEILHKLRSRYRLTMLSPVHEKLDSIRAVLANMNADKVISNGMHEFLDWLQGELASMTTILNKCISPETIDKIKY
jgi:uncharacterized alpha-E superfamily protein